MAGALEARSPWQLHLRLAFAWPAAAGWPKRAEFADDDPLPAARHRHPSRTVESIGITNQSILWGHRQELPANDPSRGYTSGPHRRRSRSRNLPPRLPKFLLQFPQPALASRCLHAGLHAGCHPVWLPVASALRNQHRLISSPSPCRPTRSGAALAALAAPAKFLSLELVGLVSTPDFASQLAHAGRPLLNLARLRS